MMKKAKEIVDPGFQLNKHLSPARGYEAACEHFVGRGEKVHGTAGAKIEAELAIVQFYPTEPFYVVMKSGGMWLRVAPINPADPALADWEDKITRVGPSPQEQAKRDAIEAEQRAMREASAAHAQQRSEAARRAIAAREAAKSAG